MQREKIYGLLKFCMIVVGTLPLMIAYPFVQKHFVKGVLIGSIKG
jgi:ABC-type glycerol-3-phosphate transport system permease component